VAELPLPTNYQTLLIESLADLAPMVLAKEHPAIDRCTKRSMGGSAAHVPIISGFGGGAGGGFVQSLANAQNGVVTDAAFDVTPAALFGHTIVNWTQQRYTVGKSSAMDVATIATEGAMTNAVDNFANAAMFSDGSGTLATIQTATNVAGAVGDLTLTVVTDVSKFQQNQVLVSAANTGAGLDAGTALVNGMAQIGGTIRVTVTGMTPTAGHIIGLQSQLVSGTNFPGIFGFIPPVSARTNGIPNVSPYLGCVRDATSAGVAVYGWAFDISGTPIFYGLNSVAGQMSNYKHAKPDTLYVNGADMPKLAQDLDAKVLYDMPSRGGIAEILYSGFRINLTTGPCEVLQEAACPAGTGVLCRASQWILGSPETPFGPASKGQIMVQDYASNNARFSVECSGFFFTENPPATSVLKLY
jgi:hypothetical protein